MLHNKILVTGITLALLGSLASGTAGHYFEFAAAQNVTGTAPTDNATTLGNVTVGNVTGGGNETATANVTDEVDTFYARGYIASIISDALAGETNATGTNASTTGGGTGNTTITSSAEVHVLGGMWKIDVIDGEVQRVEINMSMAKPDGSDFHTMLIDNFTTAGGAGAANETAIGAVNETTPSNATNATGVNETGGGSETTYTLPQVMTGGNGTGGGNLTAPAPNATAPAGNATEPGNETTVAQTTLSQDGTFEISGTATIYVNNNLQWQNVPIMIESTGRVITINVDHEMTENHFKGLPIYGFVTALIGEVDGGKESLLPSIGPEVPAAPPTTTTGPPAPNATTPGNVTSPTGNETGGGNQTPAAPAINPTGGASGGGGTEVSVTSGSSTKTDDAYDPNPVQAKVGDTVTWTNDDSQAHTVTSGSNGQPDGKFDSSPNLNPLMAPGQTFSHTFTEAGEYPYYCAIHPSMTGTVSIS